MKHIFSFVFAGLLCANLAYSQSDRVNSYFGVKIATSTVEDYIQTRMDELSIPGLSIAIINGGEIVYRNTFGYADVEEGVSVTNETIFEGASFSKPIFAFFVMTFCGGGKARPRQTSL